MTAPREAEISALKSVRYFEHLTAAELSQLAQALTPRKFSPGQIIFHMGDPGSLLYIIRKGKVKIYFPNAGGQEVVLDIFGESATFGELALFDDSPRSATIEALEQTEAYTLHREKFLQLIEKNPACAVDMMALLAQRIRHMNAQFGDVFSVLLPGRLARKLLYLAENHGKVTVDGILIPLSLTQTDLAQMTGATRVSINKAIRYFTKEGWISTQGRKFLIHDAAALERQVAMAGG